MATKAKIALAKTLNTLVAKQDGFAKAVESMKCFSEESINNLTLEIDAKQFELAELEKNFISKEKDGRISVDQKLKEYGYKEAVKIVNSNGQTAVDQEKYDLILAENSELKATLADTIQKTKEEEKIRHKKELNAVISNLELKHQAETATLTAQTQQKDREVDRLEKTIDNLRAEIDAQRSLTKDVAMAGKQGAISQTFGK